MTLQQGNFGPPGLASSAFADLRAFGATPAPDNQRPAPGLSASDAFDRIFAQFPTNLGPSDTPCGTVFIPPGRWWITRPIWIEHSGMRLTGVGPSNSQICVTPTGPGIAGQMTGFQGPAIMFGPRVQTFAYGTSLLGGIGRSLTISGSAQTTFWLHDAWFWQAMNGMTAVSIEGTWKVNSLTPSPGTTWSMLGSRAFKPDSGITNTAEQCFSIDVVDLGGGPQLQVKLTTTANTYVVNTSAGSIVAGGVYNISLNYDGNFVDVYVNGANVGHVAATGTLLQHPWQNVSLGAASFAGPEGGTVINCLDCQVQSIRLSNIARHTGTGSYSPSNTPYIEDGNTLALYNWDQGDAAPTAPFIIGQAHPTPGIGGGLIPHYVRGLNNFSSGQRLDNFGLIGSGSASGVVAVTTPQSVFSDLYISSTTKYGLFHSDPASFYSRHKDIALFSNNSIGYCASPYESELITVSAGGALPVWIPSGQVTMVEVQPGGTTLYPFIFGGAGFGPFSSFVAKGCGVDAELTFPNMRCGALFAGDLQAAQTITCNFQGTNGLTGVPPVLIAGLGVGWQSNTDLFLSHNTAPGLIEKTSDANITGEILVIHGDKAGGTAPWTSTLTGLIKQPTVNTLA